MRTVRTQTRECARIRSGTRSRSRYDRKGRWLQKTKGWRDRWRWKRVRILEERSLVGFFFSSWFYRGEIERRCYCALFMMVSFLRSCPKFESNVFGNGSILYSLYSSGWQCCCCYLLLSLLDFVGDVGMKLVMHFHQSSNIVRVNRESLLLKIGSSSQGGGDIGLDGLTFKGEGKLDGLRR